jgi:gamma-glutamyl-gamma-aminobutyrate hydrolase PuuD
MKYNRLFSFIILLFCLSLLFSVEAQNTVQTRRPLIGISCSHPEDFSSVRMSYTESVIKSGGMPVLIPVMQDEKVLDAIVSLLDGLILTGGEDIHPNYYNEDPIEQLGNVNAVRDRYDLALIRLAALRNLPTLGICRGEQLINVAFGGTLYQDLPTQYKDTSIEHQQKEPSSVSTHTVHVFPNSMVADVTGCLNLQTNSHHHQAIKEVAPGFRITALSDDGVIEAIESCNNLPVWGVQFHPEALTMVGDTIMIRFFQFMTEQAETFQVSKEKENNSGK